MRNDRLGLMLIAASLIAIAVVGGLVYRYQAQEQTERTRVHGVAITRALSGTLAGTADPALASREDLLAVARSLVQIQDNSQFAYLTVVSPLGETRFELTSPGVIAPATTMPREPFAWFGEHQLQSPGDSRQLREFFAPVVRDGQLAGFVRAGYFRSGAALAGTQLSIFGLMALPIFLLTAVSYGLIRREISPLRQLGEKMVAVAAACGPAAATPADLHNYGDFIKRFDAFIQLVQSRVQELNSAATSSQTTARMISYKQEKAESVLNSLPDAVLVLDDAGVPTFVNQKLELLLNRDRASIVGKPPHDWCASADVQAFLMRHRQANTVARALTLETTLPETADRRLWIAAFPLFSPRDRNIVFGMLFVFRDITQDHLSRQAGTDFVSHIAHELKTPLSTLRSYSELLQDRTSLPESEFVDAINVIHAEVGRMGDLISNLLNISKMESGSLKPDRRRVKLHELVQDAFASMRNSAVGRDVELELAIPPDLGSVRLDKQLFRIALDNLLSNAIKYSNEGGKVTVSAGVLEDGQIQISVRDRGIGIPADECGRIFEKYYRSTGTATSLRSGHGLGLYLAKQIIELHQGSISVSSEPGKGTEFCIRFKAQPMQLEVLESA